MRIVHFLIFLVALTLVADVDAGWKFWKKDKNKDQSEEEAAEISSTSTSTTTTTTTTTTTAAPSTTAKSSSSWKFWKKKKDDASTTAAPSTTARPLSTTTQRRPVTQASANRGIAAAADPALAVGVGNTGQDIRDNARPRRPNPGTDVGLDIGPPKPAKPGTGPGALGYNDWVKDLTGTNSGGNSGRQSPKLPSQGPALSADGQLPNQGNRPASYPGAPNSQQQPTVAPGSRPASISGSPTGQQVPAAGQPTQKPGSPTPTTARPTSTASPIARPTTAAPQQKPDPFPSLPGSRGSSPPASPTGSKSWADVAGTGGNSRPGSPTTAAPKVGGPTPTRSRFDYPQPGSAGRTNVSPGAAVAAGTAGVIGGAAVAGSNIPNPDKRFSTNPTYSKGNTVTDEDLEKLSEALFAKDVNNAFKYIKLNVQKQTTGSNPKDEAPAPLLEVKPEALQIPTIQKVLTIYDNYKLDTREHEHINPNQRQEESLLIDTFLSTNVMSAAMRFLADKGFIKKDYYDYKDTLRTLWFNLYSRGEGRIGSAGFEHVFLTELKLGTEVSGLHNWIYFNAEELKKRLDYLGYVKKVDLGDKAAIVKAHVKFNGIDKPVTNVFIGTSPELEMALYTVCFYARPEKPCPVSLGGTKFNIITHKFRYRGRDLIGSAYPDI